VSDGDTIVLSDGRKVRLIGVDTPELKDTARNRDSARRNKLDERTVRSYAKKSKAYLDSLVKGKTVRLDHDRQKIDKYGRTLAYVYREPDGLFVNADIIRQGYGFPIVHFPFKYKDQFEELRDQARKEGRGFWRTA
jgi:micrococcal nuclease